MVIAAQRGEGVSTIARALAEIAARRARRAALLIDLDVLRDSQFRAFAMGRGTGGPGLGAGVSGALGRRIFFSPREAARAFSFHRVGASRLLVSHFDAALAPRGLRMSIHPDRAYWDCARRAADCTIVDAPALQRSRVGLAMAPAMDGVVIVASAQTGAASATMDLQAELLAHNAKVLGLVYADADPGGLAIERALTQIGL
jgi:Mrp family chromosome partitioning ATPase